MVRISKQEERRSRSPKRCRPPAAQTGPKKDNLPIGFKPHANAVEFNGMVFIPKIKLRTRKEIKRMSRHPSYGKSNKGGKKRNVLKRFERVDVLRKLGRWNDEENKRVTGLPKTPIIP